MFGFFSKVRAEIDTAKNKLTSTIKNIFFGKKLAQSSIDEIEALLYSADIGVETTQYMIAEMKRVYKADATLHQMDISEICKGILSEKLHGSDRDPELIFEKPEEKIPAVICLVGANGSGKTTTAAKLAAFFEGKGKAVIVGACDTFRAAANEQIKVWSDQLNFDLVESRMGADPSSVAFDACQAAMSRKKDVAILDTAGRLHNKSHLMAELAKLKRAIAKIHPEFPQHIWLVVDASLGANSIISAQKFHEELGLTGVIVTKLDGSSRGGTIIGIYRELKIPIYFIGTGESKEDLVPFKASDYIGALFGA